MPQLSLSTPKYRKHKRSGQAVVTLSGHDHYLGPHGSKVSRTAYDRLVGEWLAAGRPSATPSTPDSITVVEVLAGFKRFAISHYVKNGRPTGAADTFGATYRIMRLLYGRQPAKSFGPLALKAVILRLIEEGRTRSFIGERLQQIKRIYKWAASEELIAFEVYERLTTVEAPRKGKTKAKECPPVLPVSDEVREATQRHLPKVVADMVEFQRWTGTRPIEVCLLRPIDIDRSEAVWKYTPSEHKTEHHDILRAIPVGPKAQAVLLRYLARDPMAYCFDPRDSEEKRLSLLNERRVTPLGYGNRPGTNRKSKPKRTPGDRYTTASYRRAIHRACEFAFAMPDELQQSRRKGATKESPDQKAKRLAAAKAWRAKYTWAPNQLRHAAATEICKLLDIEAARGILGHSSEATTWIYAKLDFQKAAAVAAKLG
jgi:site-specific recombinase XerD